jgi:hypothetical protein
LWLPFHPPYLSMLRGGRSESRFPVLDSASSFSRFLPTPLWLHFNEIGPGELSEMLAGRCVISQGRINLVAKRA